MQRTKYLLTISLLLLGTLLFAQNRTITGKVMSSKDDTPIPGATISVKGTSLGVSTLADGSFSVSAPRSRVTLIVTADVNADCKKDILLTGNNTWTRIKFGRYSANHGVVLLGNGKGGFTYTTQDSKWFKYPWKCEKP